MSDKIYVILKDKNKILGKLCYIKFLDDEHNYLVFYNPLIAPKNFKSYLKENNIYEAYIITDDNILLENKNYVLCLTNEDGIYKCSNEFNVDKKYVLFVSNGLEIKLNFKKYTYKIDDNKIYLSKYKSNKDFCYVADFDEINDLIKNVMIECEEIIPGILNIESYNINKPYIKKKKQ